MRGKAALILVLALAFAVFSGPVQACIGTQHIEGKSGCKFTFSYDRENETLVFHNVNPTMPPAEAAKYYCNLIEENLDEEDMRILMGYISSGYSVKEQTQEEYAQFLQQANDENAKRPSDCQAYLAVAHEGRWTGYVATGYVYQPEWGCAAMKCGTGAFDIKWNDLKDLIQSPVRLSLYPFLGIVLIAGIVLYMALKKRK